MPPGERAEIEEASAIMRKAHAGSDHIRLPITPVRRFRTLPGMTCPRRSACAISGMPSSIIQVLAVT
ncbi:hypothetical protein H4W33_007245 [Kibdelosporangium phytohabitans]|nr:hypothetical protein [Kibdelosporangium phytohabitans]